MTRKTFKQLSLSLGLAAAMASTSAPAYFVVSLPSSVWTMSGTSHGKAAVKPARSELVAPGRATRSVPVPAGKTPRREAVRAGIKPTAR